MKTKIVEIRDSGTFIPALAVLLIPEYTDSGISKEQYLLGRAGYAVYPENPNPCIYLLHLSTSEGHNNPYDWKGSRTMRAAHVWLLSFSAKHGFDAITNGEVIDVEFIFGDKETPKLSEQITG